MKQVLQIAVIGLSLASAANAQPLSQRSTAKGAEPFAQCFAASQDRAARPWSFVPRESGGGTFSNAGANGVRQPYFVEIADRGLVRQIRIVTEGSDPALVRAVDRCI